MGWQALRLCSWGDWENADPAGNLIVNEHVDLLDYLIAAARKRGIYMLLTPIHTYDPAFADQIGKPSPNDGFSKHFTRQEMGTIRRSIAAQANYIRQLLNHVNPYTGVALKNETAIPFVEVINEPVHHPEDRPVPSTTSIRWYVLYAPPAAGRSLSSTCRRILPSRPPSNARMSMASASGGIPRAWSPGTPLRGNFLPAVDGYPGHAAA